MTRTLRAFRLGDCFALAYNLNESLPFGDYAEDGHATVSRLSSCHSGNPLYTLIEREPEEESILSIGHSLNIEAHFFCILRSALNRN